MSTNNNIIYSCTKKLQNNTETKHANQLRMLVPNDIM